MSVVHRDQRHYKNYKYKYNRHGKYLYLGSLDPTIKWTNTSEASNILDDNKDMICSFIWRGKRNVENWMNEQTTWTNEWMDGWINGLLQWIDRWIQLMHVPVFMEACKI